MFPEVKSQHNSVRFLMIPFMDRESEIRMGKTSSCITNIQTQAACHPARTLSHDTIYPARVLATVLNTRLSTCCLNTSVMGWSCCLWGKFCLTKSPSLNTHTETRKACNVFIWPCLLAWVTLVPQPGVEITDPTSTVWSLNHWTARKVPIESWCWDEILLSAISTLHAWF